MGSAAPLETLAAWASALAAAAVPPAQHRRARLHLLDTLGLVAAAATRPAGRSLAAWAEANRGGGAHVLTTGSPAAPAVAALVHGSLAHATDFDDTFADTVVHPGSIVVTATLAAAEQADAPFAAITTAIALGYEVAGRLGAVAGRGFHARGFHATAVVGPIAAAGAAGAIVGLNAVQMADAFGLAASMSGGLLAFLADGGWSKWLHTGWSAHGGIVAAELAGRGFRGPHHALDHQYGLYGAFLGEQSPDLRVLTESLGQQWLGATARAKSFPGAHVIQPYIEGILTWRAELQLKPGDVQAIGCTMAPWALPIVATPRADKLSPRNDLEAIASLPFMVAAALADGRVDLATLHPEAIARADIRALAARIEAVGDATLGGGFDGRMDVALRDGRRMSRTVALADPSEQQIVAKFRANTAHLPAVACAKLEHAVLEEARRGRALIALALAAMTAHDKSGNENDH